MRKSDKIILSLVFMAAVNSSKASAQAQAAPASDTSRHNHSGGYFSGHGGRSWFGNLFHRNQSGPSHSPRVKTGGFGSTVKPTFRIAGS